MKKMTCNQLGGACEVIFEAETFDEIAKISKKHGMEMFMKKDEEHIAVMSEMRKLMETPGAMKAWFDKKRVEFDALPEI